MYKRLLVPTDGSELSLDAVRGAASFAEAMHSEVVLITVIEPYSYTSLSEYRPESIDDYDERVRTVAEERLAEARAILEEKGIKQTWLAEKLGKSFCIVNSYVCNRRQPSLDVLFEIARILQVDPKELIDSNK